MLNRFFTLLLFLSTSCAFAQSPAQKINSSFQVLLDDPQTRHAITSICVLDARTGKQVFARNEHIGVATASTLKTITSATAFSLLGKDFRYETRLGYSGTIEADGTLKGDLMITGGGDPTLASGRYESSSESLILSQWIAAVRKAGIKKIEGRIIGDDRLWGSEITPDGWIWQDLGNYYGAGSSALSWRENQFDLKLRAGNQVSVLKTVPEMPYLTIVNELQPGAAGSGDRAYAYLPPLTTVAYLRGTWGRDIQKSGISAAIPDPAYDAAFRLKDTLAKAGIPVSDMATTGRRLAEKGTAVPAVSENLAAHYSPTLAEIVYWLNKKSINLYAEHLLRTIAWKAGEAATTGNGAAAEIRFWAKKGLDKDALNIMDGSGLSPATRVTPAVMAEILFRAQQEDWFPEFYKSLPENNGMKLKSGTINNVSAFAGYYTAADGNKYVIVININNYSGSKINPKLFRVLDALK